MNRLNKLLTMVLTLGGVLAMAASSSLCHGGAGDWGQTLHLNVARAAIGRLQRSVELRGQHSHRPAANIRKGKILPHPRHWEKLAELVGVSAGL